MTDVQEFRGGINTVRRHGTVVHRPASPASPTIQRLLRHVHDSGFHGVPEPLGFGDDGSELLTFLDGDVPDALTPELRTPELLHSAATLLRGYHDATATFPRRADDRWWQPAREPAEVICHGDVAQYNSVVKDGLVVGLIDFDTAHTGPRTWDLAYTVYRFAPLQGPDNPDSFGTPEEQGRRVAAFCRTYGAPAGPDVIDAVPDRLRALVTGMRDRAAQGHPAFQQHIDEGHADLYERDIRYVRRHRDVLRRAFETA